ncbi:IPT/TIG domain-containing protein [Actinoplanes oblitus]|uniref:IPT/TIG domain-containing protein n=1 Tax=Actinoplanes oblitus TaxID=3040509 RepID=A0ABY8WC51_9ACTN|nr:IPT/TIG domain-containing protein [Actinoplanes oblitus]WIM94937.1 IPT/TIG domain-containing protein [Actinoplanes oblitus]
MIVFPQAFGRIGVVGAAATVLVLSGAAAPAGAVALTMTLSSPYGASGVGKTIVGTVPPSTTNPTPFAAGSKPTVQFQYNACSAGVRTITQITGTTSSTPTAGAQTVDPATVTRISTTKIAFQVPTASYPNSSINATGLVLVGGQTTAKWNVCVYDNAGTTLIASSVYTLVLKPTITSITPATSPAAGGQSITVVGTGFNSVAPISGSIAGAPLTNVKVATTGASFTATTGPRTAGSNLALTVTAAGGTVSSLDPDNNGLPQDGDPATPDAPIPFTYSNGITVSPNTAAAGTSVSLDVIGAGFLTRTFDLTAGTPTSSNSHVFLVDGAFNSSTNRGVAECTTVTVVTDTELVCTLDLTLNRLDPTNSSVTGSPIIDGAYIVTLVSDGTIGSGTADPTVISSGSGFIVAPF